MGLLNFFKLEKLKIEVYGNRLRIGLPKQTLKVMFNPESYSLSYKNVFTRYQGMSSSGKSGRYILSEPAQLSLKIIIDGTGVSEMGVVTLLDKKDVYKEVQQLLQSTTLMDGDIHEPRFLKIKWGNLDFDCRLDQVTVNYTLFDQSGKPLRAELDTSFRADMADSKRIRQEKKGSPDLTHKRIVKEHDTLPLLCESIYGTPDYYLKIAQANKLVNFRELTPGQELFFPPLNTADSGNTG